MDNAGVLGRYRTAQKILDGLMSKSAVINDSVLPHWIDDTDIFWYKRDLEIGTDWWLVDAKTGSRNIAFDRGILARALGKSLDQSLTANDLDILVTDITLSPIQVCFEAFNKSWIFYPDRKVCHEKDSIDYPNSIASPNGKKAIFLKKHNIWIRDIATGDEYALTKNGSQDCEYGKVVFPMGTSRIPFEALWSPDSRYVLSYRLDQREVKSRNVLYPVFQDDEIVSTITNYKKAYPGDIAIESYRFVVIDLVEGQIHEVMVPPIPVFGAAVEYFSVDKFGWWGADSEVAYIIGMERGAKTASVIAIDPCSGKTHNVLEETSSSFIQLKHGSYIRPSLIRALPDTKELIWFSERDGWGHLYLYDLETGNLKRQLTEGHWVAREIIYIDTARREMILHTSGRDPEKNPYYVDICSLNIDTGELTALAEDNYEYLTFNRDRMQLSTIVGVGLESDGVCPISPSGDYIVTTRSRVDTLPVSVLIDRKGVEVMVIEEARDVGLPVNWVWPEAFKVKGSDGETDLFGVIFWPTGYDASESYPILDFSGTVHWESILPMGSFVNDVCFGETYFTAASYAALGFVVVMVDVPGQPLRNKSFHDKHYGCITAVNGFEDRIACIRQLVNRYPSMDINRVGIIGYDGASAPALGMMEQPEFYKVGACCDFEDPRYGEQHSHWIESYAGVMPAESPYSDDMIRGLKGKLLLINNMRASLRPFEGYLRLVDSLQRQQKTFDMYVEPRGVYFVTSAQLHRVWDYLTENLLSEEPPKDFHLINMADRKLNELQKIADESPQITISMS